jgi:hypothetical protein
MSDSNRSERPEAVGPVFAILSAILVISVIVGVLAYSQGIESERRNNAPAAYAEAAKKDARDSCVGSEAATVFECVYEIVEASQEQAQGEQDLDAQQGMHLWAAIMAALTFGTFVLTGFALWFIKGTLEATADMVTETKNLSQETVKATHAMVRQNELTEAAQRPFVVVEAGPSPTGPNDRGQIMPASFRYRNFGGTAAQLILQAHKVVVLKEPNTLPKPLTTADGYGRRVPSGEFVGPRGETQFEPAGPIYNSHTKFFGPDNLQTFPGPPPELASAFKPDHWTFFHGFVVYADFEGRCYIRGFCFQYEAGAFRLLHPDETLNYDRRCNSDGSPV